MIVIVPIVASAMVCLMPAAFYLLFLAHLNNRSRPTMFRGQWDFTFLLLGLSGFLLVGGPLLLTVIDSNWRHQVFTGDFKQVGAQWDRGAGSYSTILGIYLAALAVLIGICLLRRARTTVFYNIEPTSMLGLLTAAADGRKLGWRPVLGGVEIGSGHVRIAFVQIDSFALARHASLKWIGADPLLRREMEAELEQRVRQAASPDNPAGSWLLMTAVAAFSSMILCMIFLIWVMFTNRRI